MGRKKISRKEALKKRELEMEQNQKLGRRVSHRFETVRDDPRHLAELRNHFLPKGSGPLATMRVAVEFMEAYAEEKGWNLDDYSEE